MSTPTYLTSQITDLERKISEGRRGFEVEDDFARLIQDARSTNSHLFIQIPIIMCSYSRFRPPRGSSIICGRCEPSFRAASTIHASHGNHQRGTSCCQTRTKHRQFEATAARPRHAGANATANHHGSGS